MKTAINPKSPENSNLTITKLNKIIKPLIKRSVIKDIYAIYQGQLIKPEPDSLGPCAYQIITKNAVPQFVINQALWKNQPDKCLAWFNQ